jgi:hypothetical protein
MNEDNLFRCPHCNTMWLWDKEQKEFITENHIWNNLEDCSKLKIVNGKLIRPKITAHFCMCRNLLGFTVYNPERSFYQLKEK